MLQSNPAVTQGLPAYAPDQNAWLKSVGAIGALRRLTDVSPTVFVMRWTFVDGRWTLKPPVRVALDNTDAR